MSLRIALTIIFLLAPALVPAAEKGPYEVGVVKRTFVDTSRPTKASPPFTGSSDRRLEATIWYPTAPDSLDADGDSALAEGGPWPLVIYSHGTYGQPDNASHLCEHLAEHGYIVVAPAYPLTSSVSHAKLPRADITDAGNQPKDVSFIIDSILADPRFGAAIDANRIGATGISLGAVTTYFASFGVQTRDPRIKASAPIAGGDPPYAALSFGLGFNGTLPAPVSVPVLLIVGDQDLFAIQTGGNAAAYARLLPPRYMVEIHGAPHVWFGNRDQVPPDGMNPDCVWFEKNTGQRLPQCARRRPLISPEKQKEITRQALLTFFDGYLNGDDDARAKLATMGESFKEVTLHSETMPPGPR